jgi:hypothetical protein
MIQMPKVSIHSWYRYLLRDCGRGLSMQVYVKFVSRGLFITGQGIRYCTLYRGDVSSTDVPIRNSYDLPERLNAYILVIVYPLVCFFLLYD